MNTFPSPGLRLQLGFPQKFGLHLILLMAWILAGHSTSVWSESSPEPAAPRLLTPPRSLILIPGTRAELTVQATGSEPLSYQWLQDDQPLPGATGPNLELSPVGLEHAGSFSVEISNGSGRVVSPAAVVRVRAAPRLLRQPISRLVAEGAHVTFSAPASGSGPLRFQWYKNGRPMPGANASVLSLQNVREADGGRYSVTVANEVGTFAGEPAVLNVLAAIPNDTDGDGLPDDYERLQGLNPNNPADASSDPDADGLSNLQEYLAGTDPRSASSALRLTGLAPLPASDGWRVAWTSVPGRTYALQRWDGRELAPGGGPSWIELGTVRADGTEGALVDPARSSVSMYRVRALDPGTPSTAPGPVLSEFQALPSPVTTEGFVTLTVRASDPLGVTGVTFLDGNRPATTATRIDAERWRALWPVDAMQNGLHVLAASAINRAGSRSTSAPISLSIAIARPLATLELGTLILQADSFVTNGNVITPGGALRLGRLTLTNVRNLARSTDGRQLTGTARIEGPQFGLLHDGAFAVDAVLGVLTAQPPAGGTLAPLSLGARCRLEPASLAAPVQSGNLQGTGLARLELPGLSASPALLEGAYLADADAYTLTVRGRVTLGSLLGTNLVATVRLADGTLSVAGNVTLPAGSGGPAITLRDARLDVRSDAQGQFVVDVSGTRTDTGGAFTGQLQGDGSVRPATTPPTPSFVRQHPELFVPLGPDGEPREGVALQALADGSLPPFDYRPAGRHLLGARAGFRLRFPAGARFIEGAPHQIEFVQAEAAFGPDSPIQFPTPIVRAGGPARRVAVQGLDLRTLAALFDLEPALAVAVFQRVPFLWKAGTLTDGGIQDAWLAPAETGIPLPRRTAGNVDTQLGVHLDFARSGGLEIQIPLFGELAMSDAAGEPIRIGIPDSNPAWLTVRSDGHVRLEGRGRAEFPNGVRFEVELLLDDPVYRLGLVAAGLRFNLLDGLADLLPPAACTLPAASPAPTATALTEAIDCRRRLDQAYFSFSAALTDAKSSNAPPTGPLAVPGPRTVVNSALDAWAWVALSRSGALPRLDQLQSLLQQTRRSAVAARDLDGVLRQRVAFERAAKALRDRQAVGADTSPSLAELQTVADEIAAAAVERASRPDAIASLASLRRSLAALLDAEQLSQRLGQDPPGRTPIQRPDLLAIIRNLVGSYSARFCDDLAIRRGAFRTSPGDAIAVLGRHALHQQLVDIVDVLFIAQQLGIEESLDARFTAELVRQHAAALETLLRDALTQAETDRDTQTFSLALADYLYLDAQVALFAADAELVSRITSIKSGLAARLGLVAQSDPTFGQPLTAAALGSRLRHLIAFLGAIPDSATSLAPVAQLTLERLSENIAQTLARLDQIAMSADGLQQLAHLIEAGTLGAAARDQFNLAPLPEWEASQLAAIATRFAEVAIAQKAWTELHVATGRLLDQAVRLRASAPLRSRAYLEPADRLLAAARQVATAVWNEEKQRRGVLQIADMLLPGEIVVEEISGELEVNRHSRELSGAFSGKLGLPQFAGQLAIENASFSTAGAFDISASGKLVFPTAEDPRLELSVLPRHPLHLYARRGGTFGMSGSCRVSVNGIYFEGFISLEDPIFGFGIATGGYRIDLPEKLFGYIPALDTARLQALPATARATAAEYLHEIGSSLETLSDLEPPEFQPVGTPPDFAESEFDVSTAPISAAVGGITLVLAAPAALGIQATAPVLTNLLGQIDLEWNRLQRDLRRAEQDFRDAGAELKSQAAVALAKAIADFARALNQVNKATAALVRGQGDGTVPPGPQYLPTQPGEASCARLKGLIELFASDARLATTPADTRAILGSLVVYQSLAAEQGCPGISLTPQQGEDLVRRATRTALSEYGLDENGNVTNPGVFEGLSEAKLEEATRTVVDIGGAAQLTGADGQFGPTYRRTLTTLFGRRQELGSTEVRRIRTTNFPSGSRTNVPGLRAEALVPVQLRLFKLYGEMQAASFDDITLKGGSDGSTNPVSATTDYGILLDDLHGTVGQIAGAIGGGPLQQADPDFIAIWRQRKDEERAARLRAEELAAVLAQLRAGRLPGNPWRVPEAVYVGLKSNFSELARLAHQDTLAWVRDTSAFQFTLGQSVQLARHLMDLARLLEASGRPDAAAPGAPALHGVAPANNAAAGINDDLAREVGTRILPPFTARVTALAQARKAWWTLTETARVLTEGLADNALVNTPIVAGAGADAAAATLAAADTMLRDLLATVRNQPVNLLLPGDLAIDRAFGEIQLNRATRVVRGSFGGKLRFPNSDFYVEVDHATLGTDGKFSFGGEIGAPIPVGGVRIKAHVDVAGEARLVNRQLQGTLTSFTGTGTLYLPPLDGTQEVELSTSVSYSGDKTLTLATLANDLDLALSRHFKLFDVGGSLAFRDPLQGAIPLPGTGELVLQGGLGLFARVDAPSTPADYLIAGENVRMRFRSSVEPGSGRLTLEVTLLDGQLLLPEIFTTGACSGTPASAGRPRLTIDAAHPLGFVFRLKAPTPNQPPALEAILVNATSLQLRDLGIAAPDIGGLAAEICEGSLDLPAFSLAPGAALPNRPSIHITRGTMRVPFPPGQTNRIDLTDFQWNLDGLPTGTVELASNLVLADLGGFRFEALGRDPARPNEPGTRLVVGQSTGRQPPPLSITGRVRFVVSPDILQKEPTAGDSSTEVALVLQGTANLEWGKAPDLSGLFEGVSLEGSFKLGSGLGLRGFPAGNGRPAENARITLANLRNLRAAAEGQALPDQQAFTVALTGLIQVPEGPAFGGRDLRFIFHNRPEGRPPNAPRGIPEFRPGTFEYRAENWELARSLPFQVSSATLALVNPDRPLVWPDMLRPENWQLTITAGLALPSPDKPVVAGQVYDWTVRFKNDGVPDMKLDAIQLGIQNLTFPPIDNIGGTVHIGGLDDPRHLFFVGRVGGFVYGYGVDLVLGFDKAGPIGACVRGTLGNIGIPLGTSGFILNGASGGISFANSNADPCEIDGYLNPDGSLKKNDEWPAVEFPTPPMSWDQVQQFLDRFRERQMIFQASEASLHGSTAFPVSHTSHSLLAAPPGSFADFTAPPPLTLASSSAQGPQMSKWETPCPDSCPPPTVNIFCEPHPDRELYPNRVIAKFSSLDESELAAIGLTSDRVKSLWQQGNRSVDGFANLVAGQIREAASRLAPRALDVLPKAAQINALIDQGLDGLRDAFGSGLRARLGELNLGALGDDRLAEELWRQVAELAYRGAPCPDLTLKLAGQLGHFTGTISGDAGVVLSTAGTAGVVADVNLVGVPVGRLDGYLAVTDKFGNFNPSLCGQLEVDVGPVDIGKLAASLVGTMSPDAARAFFGALGTCLDARVLGPLARQIKSDVVTAGQSSSDILAQLDLTQQLALAGLLQKQPGLEGMIPCLRGALVQGWELYNPELRACGEGQPRVMGIPTGPRLADLAVQGKKTGIFAAMDASASGTIAYAATLASCTVAGAAAGAVVTVWIFGYGAIAGGIAGAGVGLTVGAIAGGVSATLFSVERGMVALNFETPDPMEGVVAAMSGKLSTPQSLVKYGEDGVDLMLQKATLGGRWTLTPLGFKTASASARIVMPEWNDHPNRPGIRWTVPGTGTRASWPSPAELLLEITRQRVLPDPSWEGTTDDLAGLFADPVRKQALVDGRADLNRDYFPYGGYLYGLDLMLPRALVSAVPQELKTAADPNANPLERFVGAMNYVEKYVMTTTNVGALASYVPFPGPLVFDAAGRTLAPRELLDQVTTFDPAAWVSRIESEGVAAATKVYPAHLFFASGYLDGTLLGVPIANASLRLLPPDIRPPTKPPLFEVTAAIPTGSWLSDWVDSASLRFELTQAPALSIEEWTTNVIAPLIVRSRSLTNAALTSASANQARIRFADQVVTALATNLPKGHLEASIDNLHIPARLANLIQVDPRASARLHAFSPRYAPNETGTTPLAEAKRDGGVVLQGNFTFGNLVSVPNAEIAFLPNALQLLDPRSPPTIHARVENATVGGAAAGLSFARASVELVADLSYPAPGSREPKLTFDGRLASIAFPPGATSPLMEIRPLDGQPDLGVTLDFNLAGQKSFTISPGQLRVRGAFGTEARFRIHGATASDPFTYSATEPWTNRLTYLGTGALPALAVNGQALVQLQSSDLSSLVLVRDAAGVVTLAANVRSGARLDFFPGSSLATSRTTSATGQLQVGTDGSFSIGAAINGEWSLAGTTLPSGSFLLRGEPVTQTASLALSTTSNVKLGLFTLESLVAGTPLDVQLAIRYLLPVGTTPGRWDLGLSLPPARLRLPSPQDATAPLLASTTTFQIDGGTDAQGRRLRFTLSGDANTETTARLVAENALNLWVRNLSPGGSVPPTTEVLRFDATDLTGTLTSRGQTSGRFNLSLPSAGRLTVLPSNAAFSPRFRVGPGDLEVSSAGTFRASGKIADGLSSGSVFTHPITWNVGTTFEVTQSRFGFGLELASLANITLPGLQLTGQADFAFSLPSVQAGLSATATFDPVRHPFFEWLPSPATDTRLRGALAHVASAGQTTFSINATRLRVGGASGPTPIDLPGFTLNPNGTFERTFSMASLPLPVPGTTGSYPLRDLALTFRRSNAGEYSILVTGAKFGVAGLSDLPLAGQILPSGPRLAVANFNTNLFGFGLNVGLNLAVGSGPYADLVKSHGPQAYWRLDDNYATIPPQTRVYRVVDAMGLHSAAVTNAASFSAADVLQNEPGALPSNASFSFSAGNYVHVPTHASLNITGALTLEAWVKVRQWNRAWQTVVGKGDTAWQLHRYQSTRKLAFGTHSPGVTWHDLVGTTDLDDGRWHHVVATYDGTTKRLYVDGQLDAVSTAVSGALTDNAFRVAIGGNTEAADRAFDGWIDEVALYRRALSADEIQDHASSGLGLAAGHLAVKFPGFGTQESVRLQGTVGTNGALAFSAARQSQSLVPGLALANASVDFSRAAGSAQANLSVAGELDSPTLRALFETTSPLLFAASSTGANLVFTSSFPNLTVGPTDDFLFSGGQLRLDAAGLRLSGASLRVQPTISGTRRTYLTFNLPEFGLPTVVPAAGLSTNLSVGSFSLAAPGVAAGTFANHALANGSFTLSWKPNSLSLENFRATLGGIPGFPDWANTPFQGGRVGTDGRLALPGPSLAQVNLGVFGLQGVVPVLSENGLRLTGADLQVGNHFRLDNLLPDLVLPANSTGSFLWTLPNPPALRLGGVPFSRVPLAFRRSFTASSPSLASTTEPRPQTLNLINSLVITDADLQVPGIPAFKFSGTINANGVLNLANQQPTSINFLGFTVTMDNTLGFTPAALRDTVLADNPEAYWRLGDQYSTVSVFDPNNYRVRDETGRHSTTTPVVTKPAVTDILQKEAGVVPEDTSFSFGGGTFIGVPASTAFDLRGPITLEAWIKVRAWNRTWQTIVGKGDRTWQLHRYADTRKVSFGTHRADTWHDLVGTRDLDDGQWHHVVATYDGTVKRLYVDGLLDVASTEVSGNLNVATHLVSIGGSSEVAGRAFDGWIDEVAIYPSALSAERIEKHYRAAVGGALATQLSVLFNNQTFATLSGSIATDGSVRTHADLAQKNMGGFNWGPVALDFIRAGSSGNATFSVAATLARPAGSPVNLFAPWPRLSGTIFLSGTTAMLDLGVTSQPISIVGFPIDGVDFQYQGALSPTATPLPSIRVTNAKLNGYSLLPVDTLLSGGLTNNGALSLTRSALALGLGGFQTTVGKVTLAPSGLSFTGDFNLEATVAGRKIQFENTGKLVTFTGAYNTSKQLVDNALFGAFPLKLGGFTVNSANYKLQSSGLFLGSGTHELDFGGFKVPFTIFQATSAGLASFSGSKSGTMSCGSCPFSPSATFTVSLARSNNDGSISGTLSDGQASLSVATFSGGPFSVNLFPLSGNITSNGETTINFPAPRWDSYDCNDPFGNKVTCWSVYNSFKLDLW